MSEKATINQDEVVLREEHHFAMPAEVMSKIMKTFDLLKTELSDLGYQCRWRIEERGHYGILTKEDSAELTRKTTAAMAALGEEEKRRFEERVEKLIKVREKLGRMLSDLRIQNEALIELIRKTRAG